MSEEKLEFKITRDANGNDIELTNLSVEATNSLILMLRSMAEIISNTPGAENAKIQVVKGSATVMTVASAEVIQNFQHDFQNVLDKKETNASIVAPWRQLQNLFQANGLIYEANFYTKAQKTSIEKQIKKAKEFRAKPIKKAATFSIQFLKGKLIEVGGTNPNIHLQGSRPIRCTELEAIAVNKFLYQDIELLVRKKTTSDGEEYTFSEFFINDEQKTYFKNLLHLLETKSLDDFLFDLHFEIKKLFDSKQLGVVAKVIRMFDHSSTDVNIIKTILVITKSFAEEESIKDARAKLYHTLKSNLMQTVIDF
ncbi:MAG: hypothetical protein WC622_16665 [Pedobacter sp.]|jgi:hypothetical protein|uniref:hypothetical protein n=1 Tax=Pedobacter sp. TaxID=1411316 RepID=UPI0035627216